MDFFLNFFNIFYLVCRTELLSLYLLLRSEKNFNKKKIFREFLCCVHRDLHVKELYYSLIRVQINFSELSHESEIRKKLRRRKIYEIYREIFFGCLKIILKKLRSLRVRDNFLRKFLIIID